jgi:hypothetical protein
MYSSTLSLTSALDGVGWSLPFPGCFTPWERPITHFIGGWVGPRASLDGCGKSVPPLGFDPWPVQPVACCCTNYIILAHIIGIRLAVKLIRMDRIMILLSLNKFVVIVLLLRVFVFMNLVLILQH